MRRRDLGSTSGKAQAALGVSPGAAVEVLVGGQGSFALQGAATGSPGWLQRRRHRWRPWLGGDATGRWGWRRVGCTARGVREHTKMRAGRTRTGRRWRGWRSPRSADAAATAVSPRAASDPVLASRRRRWNSELRRARGFGRHVDVRRRGNRHGGRRNEPGCRRPRRLQQSGAVPRRSQRHRARAVKWWWRRLLGRAAAAGAARGASGVEVPASGRLTRRSRTPRRQETEW